MAERNGISTVSVLSQKTFCTFFLTFYMSFIHSDEGMFVIKMPKIHLEAVLIKLMPLYDNSAVFSKTSDHMCPKQHNITTINIASLLCLE